MNGNRRLGALIGALIVVSIFWFASTGHAAEVRTSASGFNVSHNGVAQFCTHNLSVSGDVYNFTDDCSVVPPPVDPGAYTRVNVTWLTHGIHQTVSTDVTQFFNVWGHINPTLPVQLWAGAGGTTVALVDNSPKYYRLRLNMPINPGTLSHVLTAVSYGSTQGLRANFAVVAPGAPWPTGATTPCWKPSQPASDQGVLNINPGAPNTSKCSVPAGTSADVLIEVIGNGTIALQWT